MSDKTRPYPPQGKPREGTQRILVTISNDLVEKIDAYRPRYSRSNIMQRGGEMWMEDMAIRDRLRGEDNDNDNVPLLFNISEETLQKMDEHLDYTRSQLAEVAIKYWLENH